MELIARMLVDPVTYRRLFYLLSALVLGPVWFTTLITIWSLCLGLAITPLVIPMLILLAGLKGVPRHLYEAAEIDGAGMFSRFFHVTLPMLSPTLFFIILTNIIGAFQVFNSAYVISTSAKSGGQIGDPEKSLLFYEVYLYSYFKINLMGYASALAWILSVVILAVTLFQLFLSRRWVYYEA